MSFRDFPDVEMAVCASSAMFTLKHVGCLALMVGLCSTIAGFFLVVRVLFQY